MTRPRLASRDPELVDLRVLVVGLGRSGLAASRLAVARGARVRAADLRDEGALGRALEEARASGVEVLAGGHPPELAREADLIVVSPGVPLDAPLFAEARRLDVPVWGEIELASRYCRGRIIGITGSNGKSTVTSMTGTILRRAGFAGGTGGNLDVPLAELLEFDRCGAVHALELSSFQLEAIETFRADVAVIVNLTPDHLDRYASFDDYARAKQRLLETQQPEDAAVLNADDPESRRFEPALRGRPCRFSVRGPVDRGAFLRDGVLVLRTEGLDEPVLEAAALPVPGTHNVANALAAALACRLAGCEVDAIAEGLSVYRALPHRLERLGAIGDVAFWNDSKATNVDSAVCALTSFPGGTVHLILGGKDKGADWSALAAPLRRHAHRVLLVGQAAPAIRAALEGVVELIDCGTVEAAAREGLAGARPGEHVLLSPACASFDQYRSFEQRGDDFRRVFRALGGEQRRA